MNLYDLEVQDIDGKNVSLSQYKGKPSLVVNVASQCGFTHHYGPLQEIFEKYEGKFMILGFPCNQFGAQEPGTEDEIKQFCETNFGVKFPMFSKLDVKGEKQSKIYQYLEKETGEVPKWNFHKYFIDKDGNVVKSFGTKIGPKDDEIINLIESELSK